MSDAPQTSVPPNVTSARILNSDDAKAILDTRLATVDGSSKHERLVEAIIEAITDGDLRPGDKLPPEPVMADVTGISLGTVRRALTKLARYGVVSREHGRGTFILRRAQTANEFMYARFIGQDGGLLPLQHTVTKKHIVTKDGPWRAALGDSESGYVHIQRLGCVDGHVLSISDFYLNADKFGDIMDASASQIETFGIRPLLADRFNAPTLSATKVARTRVLDSAMTKLFNELPGTISMVLEIIGQTFNGTPISYLELTVPDGNWRLDLGVVIDETLAEGPKRTS